MAAMKGRQGESALASGEERRRALNRGTLDPYSIRSVSLASLCLLVFSVLCACRTSPDTAPEVPPSMKLGPLPEDAVVYYDDRGGVTYRARIVVLDEDEWDEIWNRATATRSQPPSRPQVDFETQMLLVIAAGASEPGDKTKVDEAGVGEDTLHDVPVFEVHVREVKGCSAGVAVDIFPVLMVRVPRYDGPVSFIESREQDECD